MSLTTHPIQLHVIMRNDTEKNVQTFIEYFVHERLLVMTASRCLLYGETRHMHCSGVILAHSSTQTLFKSGRFYKLSALVPSIDVQLDSGQVIGWVTLAALFSYGVVYTTPWERLLILPSPTCVRNNQTVSCSG